MRRARQFSFSRPRGGMSVTMMLVMLALLAMLGLVEIGYLFWAKRDAQKVADLAALAGAQRLELCTADNSDNSAARQNALAQNRFAGTLQIRCG
ncbi:pilus assembly protein TadG-related protein, partial [Serratia marcescens]